MRYTFCLLSALILFSCDKTDPGPVIQPSDRTLFDDNGLFVLNEGNYGRGNGSVSFYSCDSGKIYNNVFYSVNKRSPGDIPFSMIARGDTGFIVVNNSGKIEVVNLRTMSVLKTITGLGSPRYLLPAGEEMGYVSDLYSDSIAILDLKNLHINGYINLGRNSEMMAEAGSKVYIASWSADSTISVIDKASHSVAAIIKVVREPESMAVDSRGVLWVLCSGGFMKEELPALIAIDTEDDKIIRTIAFPAGAYPTSLKRNIAGDTLYYINRGVFRMSIDDTQVPALPFIEEDDRLFYRLEVSAGNGDIFVTDAVDYQKKGRLLVFSVTGILKEIHETGIIPGAMVYRNRNNQGKG